MTSTIEVAPGAESNGTRTTTCATSLPRGEKTAGPATPVSAGGRSRWFRCRFRARSRDRALRQAGCWSGRCVGGSAGLVTGGRCAKGSGRDGDGHGDEPGGDPERQVVAAGQCGGGVLPAGGEGAGAA